MKKLSIVLVLVCIGFTTWAQSGEVEEAEIIIRKDRKITLPLATRNFEKIPQLPVRQVDSKQEYKFRNFDYSLSPLEPSFRTVGYSNQAVLKNLTSNYVKAGYGNYGTPYFESYLGSKKSESYLFNLYVRHRSSKNGPVFDDNSGNGRTEAAVGGKFFNGDNTVSGSLNYQGQKVHFYGYNPVLDLESGDIEQHFTKFAANFGIERTLNDEVVDYHLKTDWSFFRDNFLARENKFYFDLGVGYQLTDELKLSLRGGAILSKREDAMEVNRNFLNLEPRLTFNGNGFRIAGGINYSGDNETAGMNIYPVIRGTFSLTSNLSIYAGYEGGVEMNTLESSIGEIAFLQADFDLRNTEKKSDIFGGTTVTLTDELRLNAGASLATLSNLAFYTNAVGDSTRFNALYDGGNTDCLNIFSELNYENPGSLRSSLRFDFYNYSLATLTEAWHRPDYKVALNNTFFPIDNLTVTADLYYIVGLNAQNGETSQAFELDNIVDLNIGGRYQLSDQFGVFLQMNNLFGTEYQRYLNYASRGIQLLGGLSISF